MTVAEPKRRKVTVEVSRDGWTKRLQVSINLVDAGGVGHGYRIAGPKFNGSGETLLVQELDERDANEIAGYLAHILTRQPRS